MEDPLESFKNECTDLLVDALKDAKFSVKKVGDKHYIFHDASKIPILLDTPPEGMGDFTFAAFPLGKIAKKQPVEVAKEIVLKMKKSKNAECKNIGPYVNFYVNADRLKEQVFDAVLKYKEKYGCQKPKNKKIIVEHTSANPNGPFHVGRARNPIIGDTLVRVLRISGYNVTSQYYVNDMGKQAVILAWGASNLTNDDMRSFEREKLKEEIKHYEKADHKMVKYYQLANKLLEEKTGVASEIDEMLLKYEHGDKEIEKKVQKICKDVLGGMVESLKKINVEIDEFVYESKFVFDGSVNDIIEKLKESKYCKNDNGAHYLETSSTEKFYFTRKDGTSLYTTRDLAYHVFKMHNSDLLVNVLGEDHKPESENVKFALKLLGENPHFAASNKDIMGKLKDIDNVIRSIFYSFVSLADGKMSTRLGTVVFLDELIDEAIERAKEEVKKRRSEFSVKEIENIANIVGIGAIRYNILRIQPEKPMVFRWEESLNFEGNSAPFIQYAHARTCSILDKATEEMNANTKGKTNVKSKEETRAKSKKGNPYEFKKSDVKLLNDKNEIALIKAIAKFPSVIQQCADSMRTNVLAEYAHEVASLFNQFYRDVPVLKGGEARDVRLALVDATRQVLKNTLYLMGIDAPNEM
ncbi:MAG: arginine--tRNA ligase [Thermoplasmata archaeon]